MSLISDSTQATDQSPVPAIRPAFAVMLKKYLENYNSNNYVILNKIQQMKDFVQAVNHIMLELAGRAPVREDALHPLTIELLQKMLTSQIGLTPELLNAIPHVFKIFGDEREGFIKTGQQAVNDERTRRQDVLDQQEKERRHKVAERNSKRQHTLEAKVADESALQGTTSAELGEQRVNDNKYIWRKNNPYGTEHLPSFQEMLETSHTDGENFGEFLFKRVLPTWDNMSQVAFCNHLQTLNKQHEDSAGKLTLTDTALSNWRLSYGIDAARKTKHPKKTGMKPLRDSVDVMCRAFGIAPAEGEVMARHEKMLWKAINGHEFSWKDKKGIPAIEAAIKSCKSGGKTGALVKELIASSGIRYERLQEVLQVAQILQWQKGAKIQDVDMALHFLELVNPQPTEEVISEEARCNGVTRVVSRQNKELLSLITGREFNMDKILSHANKQKNPGGSLFIALTGRNGLVTLPPSEIAVNFEASGLVCSEEKIKKMRSNVMDHLNKDQPARGSHISEPYAKTIIKMVEGGMAHLVTMGVCEPLTEYQKERCIETFTGIPHPREMLKSAINGDLPIGELVRKTCDRLDLNHSWGDDNFCKQAGISNISGFINGSSIEQKSAQKIAHWFATHYDFTQHEQEQFIILARGVDLQRTPAIILSEVTSGKTSRESGLRQIYDYSGLLRPVLATQAGVDKNTIEYSTKVTSGGRIMADKKKIRRIGRLCRVPTNCLDDFVSTFDGHRVTRQSVLVENEDAEESSWARRVTVPESENRSPTP